MPALKSHTRDLLIVKGKNHRDPRSFGWREGGDPNDDGYIKASGLPLYYRAIVYKLPKRQQMGILR
ncbi:hypothetical protein HA48_09285 [Pantoea wallisii]|uniref:Uncharacterized protein n=1 Tax=Pantoea wallisii TaxID=1076551 RepID=A0A1X1D9Z5_9GAMM|nr:hypothetical protein HA48_09285 [Pantoea wallisii]